MATFRPYQPDPDFVRVRDFLSRTRPLPGGPLNWGIERWNYARYLVAPYLGTYGKPGNRIEDSLEGIRFWESTVGIWENEAQEIVAVVCAENPWPGEAFLHRHPHYDGLLDEMIAYAEEALIDRDKRALQLGFVYDHDATLQEAARRRGYVRQGQRPQYESEFVIGPLAKPRLPEGYTVRSMADDNDIEKRRAVYGLGFSHRDPEDWASAFTYRELQKAPDYRRDLDLYVVDPDGQFVSCCIAWYDAPNRIGMFEHVGTHLDYRRRGLGREVVMEGLRRLAALGARRAYVGSDQAFYLAIGFERRYLSYNWLREF